MADGFHPKKSGLQGFLDWLGNTEQIGLNVARGDAGAVGRHALDFLTGPARALLPGDQSEWEFSLPEDDTSLSEITGVDREARPLLAAATDFAGLAFDPLTYIGLPEVSLAKNAARAAKAGKALAEGANAAEAIGGGVRVGLPFTNIGHTFAEGVDLNPLSNLGKGASKVASLLPDGAQDALRSFKQGAKETFGYLDPTPEAGELVKGAAAKRSTVTRAATERAAADIGSIPADVAADAVHVLNNVRKGTDAAAAVLPNADLYRPILQHSAAPFVTREQQAALIRDRLAALPWDDGRKAAVAAAATKLSNFYRTMWEQGTKDVPIFSAPSMYRDAAGSLVPREKLVREYADLAGMRDANVAKTRDAIAASQGKVDAAHRELAALYRFRGDSPKVAKRLEELAQREAKLTDAHDELTRLTQGVEELPGFQEHLKQTGRQLTELDPAKYAPTDYTPRSYSGMSEVSDDGVAANPQLLKRRTIGTGQDLADFLNTSGATLDTDALKSGLEYAGRYGRAAEKAVVGKGLLGDAFSALSHPESRAGASAIIEGMRDADPDTYRVLSTAYNGLEPRGPLLQLLANANKVFKPAAVYGIGFPKVSAIMRNAIAFPSQLGATPEAGGIAAAGRQILRTPATIWNAAREGVRKAFGVTLPTDAIGRASDLVDQAFRQANGRASNVVAFLRQQGQMGKEVASAVEHGVIGDGFVSSESVYDSIRHSSWGRRAMASIGMGPKAQAKAFDLAEAPQAMFQATEQHARLASYLDLVRRGKPPVDAAKAVRDAFYDYTVTGTKNRTLRDLIPFAAFQTNALRQSAKLIARKPAVGSAMNTLLNQDDGSTVYPYLQDQLRLPIGKDEKGNDEYIAGIGLPVESLGAVPDLWNTSIAGGGRELRRAVVSSGQPLAKSAFAFASGNDPYFETPFGSYDKVPVVGSAGAAGRAYNVAAGTGLLQPLDTPLRLLDRATDERRSAGEKAVDMLTGANLVSVDPDIALQQQLQESLRANPEVQQYRSFYSKSEDPQTQALLEAYRQANAQVKQKRKAAATSTPGNDPGSL